MDILWAVAPPPGDYLGDSLRFIEVRAIFVIAFMRPIA